MSCFSKNLPNHTPSFSWDVSNLIFLRKGTKQTLQFWLEFSELYLVCPPFDFGMCLKFTHTCVPILRPESSNILNDESGRLPTVWSFLYVLSYNVSMLHPFYVLYCICTCVYHLGPSLRIWESRARILNGAFFNIIFLENTNFCFRHYTREMINTHPFSFSYTYI